MNILLTGGNGGIGQAIIKQFGAGHKFTTLGLRDCDIIADLAGSNLHHALDGLSFDAVIHCAGTNLIKRHYDLQTTDIHALISINAISNFAITRLLLDRGLQISCHIISDAAWTPMTHSLAYNVSKAAQLMVMRQMAHEIPSSKCLIFGVSPGKVASTGMSDYIDKTFPPMRSMTYEEGRNYQLSRLKTGEMEPGVVAKMVEWLCTTASKHQHGQNYVIGG